MSAWNRLRCHQLPRPRGIGEKSVLREVLVTTNARGIDSVVHVDSYLDRVPGKVLPIHLSNLAPM